MPDGRSQVAACPGLPPYPYPGIFPAKRAFSERGMCRWRPWRNPLPNTMLPRLLSFLSDIEHSLLTDEPNPQNGSWETTRTVNYTLNLARLTLSVRVGDKTVHPRGVVNVQAFTLADGTSCLKAALSWTGSTAETMQAIYTKPGLNWTSEARRVAALWLAGPPIPTMMAPAAQENPPLASTG